MLPALPRPPELSPEYESFLLALEQGGFDGDIHRDFASRLINATDNSIYQILPQCVVAPRSASDVKRLTQLAGQDRFRSIVLSPRGGGTGTNGQALSPGVTVDLSRHLNGILELNVEEGWVRVEPGVVLDQLNAFLKPHGLFFAPSVSPSSRATLGGMIATDACGKGSRVYGKTSGHIVDLALVFVDGTEWRSVALDAAALAAEKARPGRVGEALRLVDKIVTEKAELIEAVFPKIPRFLTGYNLAHVRREPDTFCLNPLIAGSEGTLAFVTEARLRVLAIPEHKRLVAIYYPTFDAALSAAEVLVAADPSAIETVDDTILGLARQDAIWERVGHLLGALPESEVAAVNLVEFSGTSLGVVEAQMAELVDSLGQRSGPLGAASGYSVCENETDAAALWDLRKKGVGLLGNAPGARRPIAFVEDTAVHPAKLAAYIRDFRALLDSYGLKYGMFGHVDAGCLHVRPALNMRDIEDESLLRELSDKVVALVRSYGGVMWSEHGKGFRSEYSPEFFGPELYEDLRRIKRVFDPHNQLNPGKLATPSQSDAKLVSVDALKRGHFDRQIGAPSIARYESTVNCNGNGACFDYSADSVMCPSSKVTRNRVHSPKGRATMMREWLRQLSAANYDPVAALGAATKATGPLPRAGGYDFSHEVYDAMDGCLSCKACATQCPIRVDVPQFKSEFLELYHTRYRRPLKDHFLAVLELVVVWMAWMPSLINWVLGLSPVRALMARVVGIVDTPELSTTNLRRELRRRGAPRADTKTLVALSGDAKKRAVLIVPDAFHSFYEPEVTLATYDLLVGLGYQPYVLPFRQGGKGLHVKGFLERFGRVVRANTAYYRQLAGLGLPLVGIDPGVTLAYRDEYPHALGEPAGFQIELIQEFLARSPSLERAAVKAAGQYVLMGHCTERTAAPRAQKDWQTVFETFGLKLELKSVGCCGMCGMYGHEAAHLEESRGIFEMSWKRHLPQDEAGQAAYLAQGYSCRTQVKRFGTPGKKLRHPVEILLAALEHAPSAATAP